MRILLVKTTSLGDVIHNLPVVSDLKRQFPDATIDWCVESSFAEIPALHPGVNQIIPVAVRRWRRQLLSASTWRDIQAARQALRAHPYDAIIDTQGLLKSVLIARQARGPHLGYSRESIREPLAARWYDQTFAIPRGAHAVLRNRWLAAAALDYPNDLPLDYGIQAPQQAFDWMPEGVSAYAVLLTATSRDDKLWPEDHWVAVGQALAQQGIASILPSGSAVEQARAARIAARVEGAVAAPSMTLTALAALLGGGRFTLGVDTGLTHLAAALAVPTLALYTATDPGLTGVLSSGFHRNLGGRNQIPSPEQVLALCQSLPG